MDLTELNQTVDMIVNILKNVPVIDQKNGPLVRKFYDTVKSLEKDISTAQAAINEVNSLRKNLQVRLTDGLKVLNGIKDELTKIPASDNSSRSRLR